MLDTGDWILPQLPNHVENEEIVPDKPPLFHWIAASVAGARTALTTHAVPTGAETSRAFDEWALRFPSVACGVLMVAGIALRGRRLIGDRTALLAATSLVLSAQYVRQSQYGRVDMTMAAFVTWSVLLLGEALLDASPRALLGAAATSRMAVLGKGPIGLVLPALVGAMWITIETLRRRSARWLFALPWASAAAMWAVIVLPWYVAAYAHGGTAFVRSQLLDENFDQYIGVNDMMRWSYYVVPWLYESFPWNVLAVLGIGWAWRARDRRALFCAAWWLVFLTFFQLSAYKRAAYLLPTVPVGAMMAGYFLDRTLPSDGRLLSGAVPASLRRVWTLALVGLAPRESARTPSPPRRWHDASASR
jgi:4-amino-4-deoxy-L-arabinose transferase-like glycosyltransferase